MSCSGKNKPSELWTIGKNAIYHYIELFPKDNEETTDLKAGFYIDTSAGFYRLPSAASNVSMWQQQCPTMHHHLIKWAWFTELNVQWWMMSGYKHQKTIYVRFNKNMAQMKIHLNQQWKFCQLIKDKLTWANNMVSLIFLFLVVDVNECMSNPCDHDGICNNLQNAFSCTCVNGWTGTRLRGRQVYLLVK